MCMMILTILHYITECSLLEQQIDGETLLGLTERIVERLFPVMKPQVTFLNELNKLKNLETEVPQLSCTQQEPC
ncbi:hypothetical protein UPYG_G00076600 [Umbra pygmaea]|uniref:Uncharacterized protein n=1 Tax=Umbra pygmaea TaxID=75934 RepID=A0ABD0XXH2_UMBPY